MSGCLGIRVWRAGNSGEGLSLHLPCAAVQAGDFYADRMQAGKGEGWLIGENQASESE